MPNLWNLAHTLRSAHRFVDLTHSFHPGIPHFPTDPDEQRTEISTVDSAGYAVTQYSLVGQWGTHVDPPAHFATGARTLDSIDVSEMVCPLVVLDFSTHVAENPDFTPSVDDIVDWEHQHAPIPPHAFVAFRSDWSHRWPDAAAMSNNDADGVAHYPGWSPEAIEWLITERTITAIGHETTDTDPGISVSAGTLTAQRLLLEHDKWQIELLTNLDQLPANGSIIVATWPKPCKGTGFPARVFAIM